MAGEAPVAFGAGLPAGFFEAETGVGMGFLDPIAARGAGGLLAALLAGVFAVGALAADALAVGAFAAGAPAGFFEADTGGGTGFFVPMAVRCAAGLAGVGEFFAAGACDAAGAFFGGAAFGADGFAAAGAVDVSCVAAFAASPTFATGAFAAAVAFFTGTGLPVVLLIVWLT